MDRSSLPPVLYEETFGGSSCIAPGVGLVHARSPAIVVYDEALQVVERYHLVAELVRTTRN